MLLKSIHLMSKILLSQHLDISLLGTITTELEYSYLCYLSSIHVYQIIFLML